MHGLNEYDFSARWQDAANPGFTTMDQLSEDYYDISPYAYCVNNPVNFTDPTGMGIHDDNQLGNVNCWGHDYSQDNYSQDRSDGQNYANLYSSDHSNPNSGNPLMDGYSDNFYQNGQHSQSSVPVNKDPVLKDGSTKPSYTPPPRSLPGFPDAEKSKPKGGRPRWKLPDGDIGEWDGQHGELERYNPRGKHKGVWSPDGTQTKPPVPGRTIDPVVVGVGVVIGVGILIIVTDGAATPLLLAL